MQLQRERLGRGRGRERGLRPPIPGSPILVPPFAQSRPGEAASGCGRLGGVVPQPAPSEARLGPSPAERAAGEAGAAVRGAASRKGWARRERRVPAWLWISSRDASAVRRRGAAEKINK